jgi:quercetin dioxygenase-like cupin family protein
VNAGHVLSRQYHNIKDETMHLLRGELILRLGDGDATTERRFLAGESVHIPPLTVHQIEAVEDSDVLEASTPELDDLVRLSDRYGRT